MACGHEDAPAKPAASTTTSSREFRPALATPQRPLAAAPRPTPPTMPASSPTSPTSPTSPSSTAAVPGLDPAVADVTAEALPAPIMALPLSPGQKVLLGRLWGGPASYAAVFVIGFLVAFLLGMAIAWPKYDPAALLAAGRIADVVTVVDATPGAPADWQRLKGHALHIRGDIDGMLKAYQLAVAGNAVDDQALEHAMAALGQEKFASLAVKTLEDWPGDDVDQSLLKASADQNWLRRHRATELLRLRPSATPAMRLQAEVRNAVADVRSDVCDQKLTGVKALQALADVEAAAQYLRDADAFNVVFGINDAVLAKHLCLNRELVRRTDRALAKFGK